MGAEIDMTKFAAVEGPRKFTVVISATAYMRPEVTADSAQEAREKCRDILDRLESDVSEFDFDDADDVVIYQIREKPKMYRVWHHGEKAQVSIVEAHHTPREPDDRGF